MPLTINYAKTEDKVITMGKADQPVADYYPPGATEPIVRPDDVPAPEAAATEDAPALKGKLSEDFPGYSALNEAGLTTYAKVRKSLDTLEDVEGIGKATADKIRAAMGESDEAEEESE